MLADKSEKKCLYPILSTSLTSSPKGGSCAISPLERKELQHETMLSASNSKEGNKQSAFTLAELMIIMSVMTVVIAAIAPIFTARLANASFDNVWSVVGASNMNDIYTDAPVRAMMQEVLIGVTPVDMEDVRRTYQPYSKLVIRSSNQIGLSGDKIQRQIEFMAAGTTKGYLLAGNSNLLLGGKYDDISFTYVPPDKSDITRMIVGDGAAGNTAMGVNALNALTSGKDNSAFGYSALSSLTSGSQNTAIGAQAGLNLTTGNGNTIIGYNSYNAATGDYNTVIGNNTESKSTVSNYTTAVGNNINVKGDYNTAIGDSSNAVGLYNTAIGYGAMGSITSSSGYSSFKNNTAIGYKSCTGLSSSTQNTTCIGGIGVDSTKMNSNSINMFRDSFNRVLIGRSINEFGSAATLEVHSLSTTKSKYPYPNTMGGSTLGDSSVVVNGNLIVRGQVFLNGRSPFPMQPTASSSYSANTISLMGFRLYKEAITDHKPLIGLDGNEHFRKMSDDSDNIHESVTAREHCICAYSCSATSKDYANSKGFRGRDSYDWFSRNRSNSHITVTNTFGDKENYYYNSHYCGDSYNADSHSAYNYELNKAHITTNAGYNNASQIDSSADKSCCPMLSPSGNQFSQNISSDIRLKNVESPFNDGIFMLSKLNIYNYTFKADNNKTPNVGVIAQNLKRVFPDSVSKDEKGYYKIRTDEMFYAAINAVKELNQNIAELASKINNYIVRISKLKKENKELQNQLIMLSKQLDELEK